MKITYLGHASLHIEVAGKHIIVDPFITPNEATYGIIDIEKLPAHYILITHAHQDHVVDVDAIAQRTGATIVSNYEIATHYGNKGFKMHPMNHGGKKTFDFGDLKYTNAVHTSSFPDGSYGGQPGGFILKTEEGTLYIAGDTALTMDMKLIPMQYKLDLAILPIGDNFTMGYEDAVIASQFLECDHIMGYHYDTFPPIVLDKDVAVSAFAKANKKLKLPKIGGSITL